MTRFLHLDRLRELVQERRHTARLQLRERRVLLERQRFRDRRQRRRSVSCEMRALASASGTQERHDGSAGAQGEVKSVRVRLSAA